ncbi:U2 small nuclear ribonucleoprotein auxiliary factor 35 kDa subunit-related protein 1 [Fopius arisanus]|uniref:U2 small nuclear ribonucleoprotein auxiliary factor 35 kDa subunit-related protein 1 n=1 Tax=Fopius arisanus TaxID=64838 RepID=A0A0C9RCR8_9HYME|nr:PREDICTED: U2 small nuclear ribonucleoprotein auxiliary factor 35 kDa subunit-related protein 1 [Fopius arisanus]XP_011314277.1 PREDICTED: U2 small nuclear ribonucleoprotein auxiliary factor 35 kDa subunit-related protein 1 [Fopius arisanus]
MEMGKKSLSHKEWRRMAKKERRRKIRRKHAREVEADDNRLREALERSAEYLKWIEEQATAEKEKQRREQEEHDHQERLWTEREVMAQEEWKIVQEKRSKARAEQLRQEEIIRKEFEAKQQIVNKKKQEAKNREDEELKQREKLKNEIDGYIDSRAKTPEFLREVIDSKPGKELCPFFTKTAACKYGESCSRNHRRLALGKILVIPGFYTHFSLERNSHEYDTDIGLEYDSRETQKDFREFYRDVLPELESFGRIKTLKFCRNTEVHLRGNLYVEYQTEREAARAWRSLNGRYYAGRQINCEFANISSWRAAVCGLAHCPKGKMCNFLHTFRNPRDEYDIQSPPRWAKKPEGETSGRRTERSRRRSQSSWDDSVRSTKRDHKDWRWSESPESEVKPREHRKSSRKSRDSSERLKRSKKRKPSSSGSRRRRSSLSDGECSRRREKKSHRESNKENGRSHKASKRTERHKSREKSKQTSRKSKWDEAEGSIHSDTSNSRAEEENLGDKTVVTEEYQWETTESEAESSGSPKD